MKMHSFRRSMAFPWKHGSSRRLRPAADREPPDDLQSLRLPGTSYSPCMGGNSTIIAMAKWPDGFTHIKALVLLNVVPAEHLSSAGRRTCTSTRKKQLVDWTSAFAANFCINDFGQILGDNRTALSGIRSFRFQAVKQCRVPRESLLYQPIRTVYRRRGGVYRQ
jgi:hypothetical protein